FQVPSPLANVLCENPQDGSDIAFTHGRSKLPPRNVPAIYLAQDKFPVLLLESCALVRHARLVEVMCIPFVCGNEMPVLVSQAACVAQAIIDGHVRVFPDLLQPVNR